MDDDRYNRKDEASKNSRSAEKKQPDLQQISDKEITKILEDHDKWLQSNGKDGERANLGKFNLRGANLERANLERANFGGVNIEGANLKRANLKETILYGIEGLSECSLIDANLFGATGLRGKDFARMDLTGTTLPVKIEEFKTLDTIEEISKNARTIFLTMLLGCVYSWLTIATTTDVRLLTNSSSSPLPIIGAEIPIVRFYWAAPFILICLFFYLHFYLYSLWEGLASLPAIFPDGKRLDEKAYPWLLNKLVRRHFSLLKKNRPPIAYFTELVTIFLAFWTVPATLIGFWIRYLPRHDWLITGLQVGLIIFSAGSTIIFYSGGAKTLRGKERRSYLWKRQWRKFFFAAFVGLLGVLFWVLSYGAINGVQSEDLKLKDIKVVVPWIFQKFGFSPFADFREKDVSIKPIDYYKIESVEKQIESVKGANLKGIDLRFADLDYSFMVKADLRFANLQNTQLSGAKLQNANLSGVMLQNANLKRANLYNADLSGANLQNANLERANLQNANLLGAKLQNANLSRAIFQDANLVAVGLQDALLMEAKFENAAFSVANFQNANLKLADFRGADLRVTLDLKIEQLAEVATLYKASLDNKLMEQLNKDYPHLLLEPKKE